MAASVSYQVLSSRYSRKGICVTVAINWRGGTLLPVITKIFSRKMLERIKIGIDKKLRKRQAGFRPKRSTTEQMFILRNILEQANEWRAGPYIHFVDFEKALDSVHRESL